MSRKKLISAALALIMFATILTGCLQKTTEGASSTAASSSPATADPFGKYDPDITITMARTFNSTVATDANDPDKKDVENNRWITTFKDKLGISVKYKWVSPDNAAGTAKWSAAVASGDLPDAGIVDDTVYQQLVKSNDVADMSSIYNEYASSDYKAIITDDIKVQMMIDGKMLGLPFVTKAFHGSNVLDIRKDWLDKLGLSVPKTMDEVISVAKAFQKAKLGGDNTIGIVFGDGTSGTWMGKWEGFLNAYGAYLNYWIKKDNSLVYSNVQPEMETALTMMQKLYAEGVINNDIAVAKVDQVKKYIVNGIAGMWYIPAWGEDNSVLYENDPKAEVINILPPSATGKSVMYQTNTPTVKRLFINKNCKNPEAVVKMLNLQIKLVAEDYNTYAIGTDGFVWFKYLPWGDLCTRATMSLDTANDVRQAVLSGSTSNLVGPDLASYQYYDTYIKTKDPKMAGYLCYGPGGAYNTIYDAYHNNLLLLNQFVALPTTTQQLKGSTLDDNLSAAMIKVIMGADISTYKDAEKAWATDGGTQITSEVNKWYKENTK